MHGVFSEIQPVLPHLPDDKEAYSSEKNQAAGDQIQHNVVLIRNQILKIPEYVKAGIVKGRHGVKQTDSDCLLEWIILNEDKKA